MNREESKMFDEKLSIQQKEQILEYLMKCYRKSANRMKRFEECDVVSENKAEYCYDKTTVMLVEAAMEEIGIEERRIIEHDYMHPKENQWYLEFYTRSTYYRIRSRAIDKFLRCLHA